MQELVVLQRQPLREHDWLLDVFCAQRGRLHLVLNRPTLPPDLFTLYRADWQTTQEWPQIKGWQQHSAWSCSGTHLYCALYLNELLVKLLPFHEQANGLFDLYNHALAGLMRSDAPDPWLRLFEWQLLQHLGYGFSWLQDANGRAINTDWHYVFVPSQGFVASDKGYLGADIMAFANGARDLSLWKMARAIFRKALDDVLQRPLCSRELLTNLSVQK